MTTSPVHQYASMAPSEFGKNVEPKWQVAGELVGRVRTAVEQKQLTPLDGARLISSIAATLFGYDEFILREISPQTCSRQAHRAANNDAQPDLCG